jgi:uncharacterized protein (DUF1800 family)
VDAPIALRTFREAQFAVNTLTDPDTRRAAQAGLNRTRSLVAAQLEEHLLAQAVEAPSHHLAVPEEAWTWFWFNHFNVFAAKGIVGVALPSYVEGVIRPRLRGPFAQLLLAVVTHPAMLVYLDNVANASGRLNENLARELLELHTLGVGAGYTQADVQETARLLTGFGLRPVRAVEWPVRWRPLVREQGEFLFNPRRHDFGDKVILGMKFTGEGFDELPALCQWLTEQPATARHVVRRMVLFIAGDDPPAAALEAGVRAFRQTGGHLGATADAIIPWALRPGSAGHTFKLPLRWLVDAAQLVADGRPVGEPVLLRRWLASLGQGLFARTTPDGYPLEGRAWLSAGQLTQRFEVARALASQQNRLFSAGNEPRSPLALWQSAAVQDQAARASRPRAQVIEGAEAASEKLALLLASPEFMHH